MAEARAYSGGGPAGGPAGGAALRRLHLLQQRRRRRRPPHRRAAEAQPHRAVAGQVGAHARAVVAGGIVDGLSRASTCAVIVGPAGLGDWAREELAVAHDRAAKDRDFRLFLVLLPGAPEITDPRLAFLRTRTWVDLRAGIADPDAFQDLISAVTGAARTSPAAGEAEIDDTVAPYRGLASFEEEQAEYFFGREDDTARII